MNQSNLQIDWKTRLKRQRKARSKGEEIAEAFGFVDAPVDPLWIASQEYPLLKVRGANFGSSFDGQLEFHASHNRFLLFYNSKYEEDESGCSHVRTRFSVGHELGHYYLPSHREYLLSGGQSHQSNSEFIGNEIVESEADCFSAGLLTPSKLVSPLLNRGEPTFDNIISIAGIFNVSIVSTAITCVDITHYPAALIAIKDGKIAWQSYSDSLIEYGCYPGGRLSSSAIAAWNVFAKNPIDIAKSIYSSIPTWSSVHSDRASNAYYKESYFGVPVMGMLLVLLTADEKEIMR